MCYWPPVHGVCPNYEMGEFQPQTVNPPKPRLRRLLLHSHSWTASTSHPDIQCPSGGGITLLLRHPLHLHPYCIRTGSSAHQGISCLGLSITILPCLYLTCCCTQTPPQPLISPQHAWRIPVDAAPLTLPKSLLTWPSDVSTLPHFSTTAPRDPPL